MANQKVIITGINTSELCVLKNEETIKLFEEYQSGNKAAKERIINGNLKLVLSILKRFNNGKHNLDDLFQIGCIGLIKAIDNFDLSYGLQLSTYATPLIIGEIKRYIRDNSAVRISRSIKDLAYKIITYKEEYLKIYGVEASNKDISKYFNIEEYEIAYALDSLKETISIFEPIYNDGGDPIYLLDQLADQKELRHDYDTHISLKKALDSIKKKEREVLIDRFIIGKTQMEIADGLGISQAQVSRIEKNAISNIKSMMK